MDEKYKRARLDRIHDEVKEFHPFLQALLPRLPEISAVEYTHGPNELGADFVLTRLDSTLGDTEYVGVVAKVGGITQGSLGDVQRQIRETRASRPILGGSKSVRIASVWVVASGRISANAKDFIHDEHSDKNVKFVDQDRLITLVDRHAEFLWSDLEATIGSALARIHALNEEADRRHDLLAIGAEPFYVDQEVHEWRRTRYDDMSHKHRRSASDVVDVSHVVSESPFTLIEGGMGIGKSKLLRQLVRHFSNSEVFGAERLIPIMVSLREILLGEAVDVSRIVDTHLPEHDQGQISDSRILLLVDGFDEVPGSTDEQLARLQQLQSAVNQQGGVHVVVASRNLPASVDSDWDDADCRRLEIAPLTIGKTLRFLKTLCDQLNVASRLIEDLKRSPLFRELPRTPISAILLARLLNENSSDLPTNLTELYSKYLDLMLGRWDIEKGLKSQREYEVGEKILMKVAAYALENNVQTMTYEDFLSQFERYLQDRNLSLDARELCNGLLSRSQIVRRDERNDSVYFSHRTFAEFLYAKAHVTDGGLPIDRRVFNIYWINTYFFYLGLRRDCPQLLREINDVEPEIEPERWIKVINMANYMFAAYSSPYGVVSEILPSILLQAASLYVEITDGKTNTVFSFLSEIGLLWWVQMIIRESYSFEFFERAIDEAAVRITDSTESRAAQAYALFFLGVIGVELKTKEPFGYLIEAFRNDLPENLQYGLYFEGRDLHSIGKTLKKQLKWIRQRIDEVGKDGVHKKLTTPMA